MEKLTALRCRTASPGKHFDGLGLYLHVKQSGTRTWRLAYRFGDLSKTITFGNFPEVTLAEARVRRDDARRMLRDGKNPSALRQAQQLADRRATNATFPAVAEAWLEQKRKAWAPATYRKAKFITDTYLVPVFRKCSVETLGTAEAADALEAIADRVPALASKARQHLNGIIQFAIRKRLREDGRILLLRGLLPTHRADSIPAATDPQQVAELARGIEAYPIPVTRHALKIAMLTAQRPGNVADMRWQDIDLHAAEWRIPAELMKTGHAHVVPLSRQAVATLKEMGAYSSGRAYVFPPLARQKTPHLHRDALSAALRRMGFAGKHATHGFRAMFRTVARERLHVSSDVLEAQLAHRKRGEVAQAYDRTQFIDERHQVMQRWSDYLDQLRGGGTASVVPIRRVHAKG